LGLWLFCSASCRCRWWRMAFCTSRGRGLHSSQRYLSGASFSSYMPTHAPCCHTEHLSQKMVNPSSSSIPQIPSHVSIFPTFQISGRVGGEGGLHRIMPLSSGDSGPPRGDSWSPFSNGGRISVWWGWWWSVSEREALPSGIVLLSTSEWIISLLRDSLKLTE